MTKVEQVEMTTRVEIVFRALMSDMAVVAGVFAENRFTVKAGVVRLKWDVKRFGKLADPVKFSESATAAMHKIGLPARVLIEEAS